MDKTFHDIVCNQTFDIREVIERLESIEDSEDEQDIEECKKIESFLAEVAGCGGDEEFRGEWYPLTFIMESYFPKYAKDLIIDINGIPKNLPNYLAIDWEQTAENLKVDYSEVEIGGVDFFYR